MGGRGSIQFMSAGTGIRHSEFNHEDKPLRFVQVWISPKTFGGSPRYGSYDASPSSSKNNSAPSSSSSSSLTERNQLRHLASDIHNDSVDTPVKLNQDVDCHTAEMELGKSLSFDVPKGRQAYLLCVEGKLQINGKVLLNRHDAIEISTGNNNENARLEVEAKEVEETENGQVAHFLMFTMKEVVGSGRQDI